MNQRLRDFVSTFKKPKPIPTVADEIKRLNKNENKIKLNNKHGNA